MSKKLIVVAVFAACIIVLTMGIGLFQKSREGADSETESSLSSETEKVIVPLEIPDRIQIEIPSGFSETSSDRHRKYYVLNDASIIITGEQTAIQGESLESYTENMKKQYAATADDFEMISEETVTVDGVFCNLLEFSYALVAEKERLDTQCLTGVLLKDDYAYLITCKSRKENFSLYRDAFLQAVKSAVIQGDSPEQTGNSTVSTTLQS